MDAFAAFEKHVNPYLGRFLRLTGRDMRFVRADGCTLTDDEGASWDDWIAGFGAFALGHNAPELSRALTDALSRGGPTLFHEAVNPAAGELAHKLCRASGGRFATVHFSNSGAEAVETAIKIAVRSTLRPLVAYAAGGYHGTTLGALGCMAKGAYRDDFEALVPRFVQVPFGDPLPLARVMTREPVAAVLLEPVQIEAGVRVAPRAYLSDVRSLCDRHGALLVLDEVQTGLGRTGALFQHLVSGIAPDMSIVAKALGGGLVPIGATLAGEGLWDRAFGTPLRCNIHESTYGGGALACAVAGRVLDAVGDPAFLEGVRMKGERLFASLRRELGGHPLVERVEGVGLLGGIALRPLRHPWLTWDSFGMPELEGHPLVGPLVIRRLARARIFAHLCAHAWDVVRVEPPLVVDEGRCERFVAALREAVDWVAELDRGGP